MLRARQARALRCGPETFLLERVSRGHGGAAAGGAAAFRRAADIGTPGEGLQKLARVGAIRRLCRFAGDRREEVCRFAPESLDLAVSALAFQFVNDLPGVLAQIRRALKPDGLLLAAMLGGDTLTELRQSVRRRRGRM